MVGSEERKRESESSVRERGELRGTHTPKRDLQRQRSHQVRSEGGEE